MMKKSEKTVEKRLVPCFAYHSGHVERGKESENWPTICNPFRDLLNRFSI